MKQLSTVAALCAVVVASFIGSTAQAQILGGRVAVDYSSPRDYPAGTMETGRYARFILDSRLSDMNFKNRDFENWRPLDAKPRQMMRHFLFGRPQTTADSPIPDQEIGRYVRVLEDDRLVRNNLEFEDRDFYPFQEPSPYTAQAGRAMYSQVLHGLSAGTNLGPVFPEATLIGGSPRTLYFWQ